MPFSEATIIDWVERGRVPEVEYIFKHRLTQEAAYASLLRGERRAAHRRVAQALERVVQTSDVLMLAVAGGIVAEINITPLTDVFLVLLIILVGIWPNPLAHVMHASIDNVAQQALTSKL